ncbi:hypothetical protein Tco_0150852, partial [Tanacetum coccineum]
LRDVAVYYHFAISTFPVKIVIKSSAFILEYLLQLPISRDSYGDDGLSGGGWCGGSVVAVEMVTGWWCGDSGGRGDDVASAVVAVSDEAVHKELGDRMERAATITSSLKVEQDSGSGPSHIKNALTECPTLYASLIEQFWQTAALSTTEDGVRGITATIDRKVKKVESLESELKQTKQTYHAALTKLIKRVKKLEQTIKISQARRRAKVVISDAEEDKEDPSKQGRSLIEELDLDAGISLVPTHAADQGRIDDTQISDQPEEQLGVFSAATALADAARRRQSVENVQTYTRRSRLVSTADVSTASELGSTAGVKAKDKGKAIMQESEPPKKIKKRVQVQMSVDEELAKKELDKRKEVVGETTQAHDIDWSDPVVLRYHTLQNRPFSVAEVRKNMCMYLKNQGGYKLSHFKGMSYEDIRPIFERVWDQNQAFVPKDSEIEKEVMKRSGFDLQQEFVTKDEASSFVQKQSARGSRKKSLARKRARETLSEESAEETEARNDPLRKKNFSLLTLFPEDESLNIESWQQSIPIVLTGRHRF